MIYLALIVINLILLFVLKTKSKYWLIGITFWVLVILAFIAWHYYIGNKIETTEALYQKSMNGKSYGDFKISEKLDDIKDTAYSYSTIFINIICLQSIITFLSQIAGYYITKLKVYKWTIVVFTFIAFFAVVLELLFSIVPRGGIAG